LVLASSFQECKGGPFSFRRKTDERGNGMSALSKTSVAGGQDPNEWWILFSTGTSAALIGFISTFFIVLQGFYNVGASTSQAVSALAVLCLFQGVMGVGFSLAVPTVSTTGAGGSYPWVRAGLTGVYPVVVYQPVDPIVRGHVVFAKHPRLSDFAQ